MSNVTIDLSDYKDTVGGRVEPGRYRVIVEDADLSKSKAGNQMIVLGLKIIAPGTEADGATIVDRLTQTSGALFRTVNFMQALGMPTPRKRLQINLSKFTGKVVMVDVEDGDEYQGRVKSEVRGYYKVTGGSSTEEAADLEDADTEDIEREIAQAPEPKKGKKGKKAKAKDEAVDEDLDLDDLDLD